MLALDAARARKFGSRATQLEVLAELDAARAAGERRTATLARAIAFSTALSDSPGESLTRIAMHRAGFTAPVLQQEFRDAEGSMWVDFWWPEIQVVVEFDGKMKYTRAEFTGGDPGDVVWREKKREDRLRRIVKRVDRLIMPDVMDPIRLHRILSAAGVPKRPR